MIRVDVTFAADWPGFEGHFPGQPIVPGAALIDVAATQLEAAGFCLVRLDRAAFAKAVGPDEPVTCELIGDEALDATERVFTMRWTDSLGSEVATGRLVVRPR